MKNIHKIINLAFAFGIITVFTYCANPVSPSGGPQDQTPPKMVDADPPLYTKNFKAEKIKIEFNEFVELKDLNNQLIVSPPMKKNPEVKIRSKSIIIEFEEDLLPETTYNLFFGDAIVDITEGNPYSNFQYIFSTGNILDSLSITGNVFNAFDNAPPEITNVMLYLDNNDTIVFDSLPYFIKPYFMTKTNENGDFTLNNLPNKKFKLFALLDVNANLIYDQPNEQIAFIDSLVYPYFIKPVLPDSLLKSDTIPGDSLSAMPLNDIELSKPIEHFDLALFQEVDSMQRFIKAVVAKKNQINFIFKTSTIDPQIRALDIQNLNWSLPEVNLTRDTITYWLKNTERDSIRFEISDDGNILDTINMSIRKRVVGRKQKKDTMLYSALTIKSGLRGANCDLYQPIHFTFGYPVETFDFSKIQLLEHDSVPVKAEFIFSDSINRKLNAIYKWKESTKYTLVFPDSIFYDIHGQSNDSLVLSFTSKSIENYGNLFLNIKLSNPGSNYIIQLLKQDKVVLEKIITEEGQVKFESIDPGEYQLKVIFDLNNNGIWDTGNYLYKLQPEKVNFFPNTITIRGNWDLEEDWEL